MPCFTVVPPEVIARGRPALEAYNKALAEGKTFDKRVPIMLIGQERSGKTSLKRSLRGESFNPYEESTVGIDVDPFHFKVTTENWKVGEKDQETNSETSISYEYHAARATVETLRQEERAPDPEEKIPDVMQSGNNSKHDTVKESASNDVTSVPSAGEIDMPSTSSLSNGNTSASSSSTSSHESVKEAVVDSEPVQTFRHPEQEVRIPKDVETEVLKRIKGNIQEEDEEAVYSVLWDFAGQSVYYTTHPLFITPRAVYLLVYDLSQDPEGAVKPILKKGLCDDYKDSCGLELNRDCLDFWMSSVASLASQQESDQVSSESEVLPETQNLPVVFLVFTHADTPYGGPQCDPFESARKIYGYLRTKPCKPHLHGFFVVDNTKSGRGSECKQVVHLRKEVLAVSKKLPQMKEAIPIKWLKCEKEFQVMIEEGKKWITLEAAKNIASEKCNIIDDEGFRALLNFLHDKRILIHFDDTPELDKLVILDPQWLIDVFKEVITVKRYEHIEKRFEELWENLEKGILEERLLEHVWAPYHDSKETSRGLIAIMEKFSLLCRWPSSEASCGNQYLVPSMLMSYPPEKLKNWVASAQIPPLFLKFESGQVPLGLFPRLLLKVFQCDKEKSPNPHLYHNFARFYRDIEKKNYSLILQCYSSFIKVVVHRGNGSHDDNHDPCYLSCAHEVRKQLVLILESMRKEFSWLKNMTYEISFLCPVCCQGGAVNNCRTHRRESCKQEECLHFLYEWQLVKAVNAKEEVVCKESADARDTIIQPKQFSPWFAEKVNNLVFSLYQGNFVKVVDKWPLHILGDENMTELRK